MNKIEHPWLQKKRGISPVVATMILIVVAVAAATSFALILSGFQLQAEKQNNQITNAQNEDLQIAYVELLPLSANSTFITGMNVTVRNLDTSPASITGVEVNGQYTSFSSITNVTQSPYSVLLDGIYVPTNMTQPIAGKGTLQLQLNLSADQFAPISRTSGISINLLTASLNTISFSILPPVAQFFAQQLGTNVDLLNASNSFSPDTYIQAYDWTIFGTIPGQPGGILASPPPSGKAVQYFPSTPFTNVTLTVVDSYGLVSTVNESLSNALEETFTTTTSTTTTTTETFGGSQNCGTPSTDMVDFVCPFLNQLEGIREILMTPYHPGQSQSYGYYAPLGLTCGGNIEPSPAIGVSNGYNNVCVITDNNIEGGFGVDYFNSPNSVLATDSTGYNNGKFLAFNLNPYFTSIYNGGALNTNVYSNVRSYLSPAQPWFGIGSCSAPFTPVYYPTSFSLLDRREGEYGFIGPYASTLDQPGVHLGGIGHSCGTEGQVWYVESGGIVEANPYIVTEMPGSALGPNDNLEELSFYIDEAYMQCIALTAPCSVWQTAYLNAMSQYPFQAPRQALHFIQVTRATQAWNAASCGCTFAAQASADLTAAITKIFTPTSAGGALGPDGGLTQQWGGGGDRTPEPNMQAMIAFDPDMPNWFTTACYLNQADC